MRRRPTDVEEPGQHVATFGRKQAALVARMRVALVAGHEARAHHDSRGACGERGTRRRRIGNPAGGEQGQRHRPADLGQQRKQTDDALDVATGLDACTISASAPAVAAARAASAEATCTSTRAPPARARGTNAGRSPNENDTHGTRSSTATSSRSSCATSSTRFTQNGRSMTRAIERTCSRSTAGSVHDAPSVPRPPARDTSLASRAAAPRPSGACISGDSQPSALTARAYPRDTRDPIHPSAKKITTLAVAAPLYAAVGEDRGTAHGLPTLRSAAVLDACKQARMQKPVQQGWPHIGGRSDAWVAALCSRLRRASGLRA